MSADAVTAEAAPTRRTDDRLMAPVARWVVGIAALVSLAALVIVGLFVAPPDAVQGDAQRLMYLHVPAAWVAYLAFGITALGSVLYLWKRTRSMTWDRIAAASAEIGVLFTAITLATGMIWGHLSWGVFWTWDARLTTTALLFVFFGLTRVVFAIVDGRPRMAARTNERRVRETAGVVIPALVLLGFSLWLGLATPEVLRDAWSAAVEQLSPQR